MRLTDIERRKRILTALNQTAWKRFTFEYGCCSSKGERVMKIEEKPRKRGEERHCYSPPQGIEGFGK